MPSRLLTYLVHSRSHMAAVSGDWIKRAQEKWEMGNEKWEMRNADFEPLPRYI